ncbi:sigma-70 family RNA polymerase sigma factor [Mucilaginibacter sp. HMF5004]|uniref:RNA polymerase sigma factor n=1 Tax=Mucilaginibacter rivuli TaxID=2857527 RepID=UPI001C5F708C|nr:sigma-70 family RNA polymerase sigma factor [Mucilaginibacter rivuli]MBW4890619.1 sigma-70 family RNA polymerase sigma factor [Mucilaginibacter rivuli]
MSTVSMPVLNTLDGFESIFKENYSPLFRYVNGLIKNEALAKDVLSDLFLNLWQQKDQLQINNLKPYLFRAAKYGALKAITASRQTTNLPDDLFDIPTDTYNPFEKFVAKQSIRIVEDMINNLSPLRKQIIELRLLGLKYAEIAEALAIPEKKVEYNLREAMEQLTKAINHSDLDKASIAGGMLLISLVFNILN